MTSERLARLLQVAGARSLGRVDDVERHLLAFLQRVEVDGGELGAMKEHLVAVITTDKAKASIRDDLLDAASSHGAVLQDIR